MKNKFLLLAVAFLANHPKLKADVMKVLGTVEQAAEHVAEHLKNIEGYFENHPTVDTFHSTSNGAVFVNENDAQAHAASLDNKLVVPIQRNDLVPPAGCTCTGEDCECEDKKESEGAPAGGTPPADGNAADPAPNPPAAAPAPAEAPVAPAATPDTTNTDNNAAATADAQPAANVTEPAAADSAPANLPTDTQAAAQPAPEPQAVSADAPATEATVAATKTTKKAAANQ